MSNSGHCQTSSQYTELHNCLRFSQWRGGDNRWGSIRGEHTSLSSSLDGAHCDCELMAEDSGGANYRDDREV
jgi:hypothetical protein